MVVLRLTCGDAFWQKTIAYADGCMWAGGKRLAYLMENNRFTDWESVFIATEAEVVVGFCTLLKEDYFPENRYTPWISTIFVDKEMRGGRISQKLIEAASARAKEVGFTKVYIPSDLVGLYEKYGFTVIDSLLNYEGTPDTVFVKEI